MQPGSTGKLERSPNVSRHNLRRHQGSGTVAGTPGNITECKPGGDGCFGSFAYGTDVTLTATPSTGYTFAGWSGAGCSGTATCSVTVTANTSVDATFSTTAVAPASASRSDRTNARAR